MNTTIPINRLSGGEEITPRFPINDSRTSNWKYRSECDAIGSTIVPGALLKVVDVSKQPGAMRVRVQIPGRSPAAFLKLAGEEYANVFRSASPLPVSDVKADLTYNIVSERLTGMIDTTRINVPAGSGGRAGSKVEDAVNWRLQNNPLATHVGGKQSTGTHNFGPIPLGRYTLQPHETRANWIRLIPDKKNVMHGRAGFAIHGQGQTGSHGCIVPSDFGVILQLMSILKRRALQGVTPPTLDVVAIGSDPDLKFRAV
jgi:hypothetical protein